MITLTVLAMLVWGVLILLFGGQALYNNGWLGDWLPNRFKKYR